MLAKQETINVQNVDIYSIYENVKMDVVKVEKIKLE